MSCQSCHIFRKCIWRESIYCLLSVYQRYTLHYGSWLEKAAGLGGTWRQTQGIWASNTLLPVPSKMSQGWKTTWIKCIRIPRFVGSSSWSSLGKKWKRNTWRLFLSPKFAQTSERSDLARRIGAVAMLPTHAKQMAAHIELVEEYFWAVSSWMSCISGSMCRVSECFHLWPWPVFFFLPFTPLQIRQIIGELCDRLYEAQYGAEAEEKRFTLAQSYVSYRYNYTSTFNSRRFTEQKPGRFNLSWVLCWWTFLFRSGENK